MREEARRKNLHNARMIFTSLDFYVSLFGLAMCRAWIVLCLSAPFATETSADWIFLIPGGIIMLVIGFCATRLTDSRNASEKRFDVISGILVGACVICAPLAMMLPQKTPVAAFMVLCGVTSSCIQLRWGVEFARRRLEFSMFCYPASAIVTAFLVAGTLAEGSLLALCVFPPISLLLLLISGNNLSRSEYAIETSLDQKAVGSDSRQYAATSKSSSQQPAVLPRHTIVRLLISIAVFSFLCRFYDDFPVGFAGDPLSFLGGSSVFALVITGVAFLLFVTLAGRTFDPLLGYRLSLPLMALGMAIVALFFMDQWYLSVLFIGIGYELFDTLTWMLLVMLSHDRRVKTTPYAMFGFGTAATMIGMGCGRFAAWALQTIITSGPSVSTLGVVGVMTLIITAFLVIPEGTFAQLTGKGLPSRDRRHDEEGSQEVPKNPTSTPLEDACTDVAEEFRLTPRESEVLVLLARGRTLAIVVRDLGIAKGTAQTHIENVYQKLGVHKQQELIDLVESYAQSR